MKIALIGFGNMGQELAKLAEKDPCFDIVSISYRQKKDRLDIPGIQQADVAIDFTSPEIVMENIVSVTNLGVHMVVGTTGWYDEIQKVKKLVTKKGTGLI